MNLLLPNCTIFWGHIVLSIGQLQCYRQIDDVRGDPSWDPPSIQGGLKPRNFRSIPGRLWICKRWTVDLKMFVHFVVLNSCLEMLEGSETSSPLLPEFGRWAIPSTEKTVPCDLETFWNPSILKYHYICKKKGVPKQLTETGCIVVPCQSDILIFCSWGDACMCDSSIQSYTNTPM